MCGRYAASRNPEDLVEEFRVDRLENAERLAADYNVAPTDTVPAVLTRAPKGEDVPVRTLRAMRWGLVPSWAKDAKIGSRLINARLESADSKPAFRKAFAKRRCLLPADGFYEWYTDEQGRKQPYFIRRRDGLSLAMAGLYELWRDDSLADDDPDAWLWTSAVLTTEAIDDVGRIHDRMPLLVEPESWERWLDPHAEDPHEARSLLVPAAPGLLEAYPVSTAVNNVRNDGPELVEPLAAEPVDEPEGLF